MTRRRTLALFAVCVTVAAAALAARPDGARAGGSTIRDTRRTDGVVFETKILADYLGAPIDELRRNTYDRNTSARASGCSRWTSAWSGKPMAPAPPIPARSMSSPSSAGWTGPRSRPS